MNSSMRDQLTAAIMSGKVERPTPQAIRASKLRQNLQYKINRLYQDPGLGNLVRIEKLEKELQYI